MKNTISILKSLSDGNRIRIIYALSFSKELCACQITELIGVTGATISRHLSVLSNAGIINKTKSGRWIYFSLNKNSENEKLIKWIINSISDSDEIKRDKSSLKKILNREPNEICRGQRGEKCCP